MATIRFLPNGKKTKEYQAWVSMKRRCYNKKQLKYPNYGGRGIIVCERWLKSYEFFLLDMGLCPESKSSLDRIDVNGNYSPENCKWSDAYEQMNNTTRNKFITHNNETLTISQWAVRLNWNKKLFDKYIRMGKDITELAKRHLA